MKHLKLYEEVREPQVGDYVYVKEVDNSDTEHPHYISLKNFFENNVGQLINNEGDTDLPYVISFDSIRFNIPEELVDFFNPDTTRYFNRKEILYFNDNKEDVETYIQSKKFNL